MKRRIAGFVLLACFLVAACVGAYGQANQDQSAPETAIEAEAE